MLRNFIRKSNRSVLPQSALVEATAPVMEECEARRMLAAHATANLAGGVLTVIGTRHKDDIVVALNADDATKLDVTRNGALVGEFDVASVTGIFVGARTGNDRVTIDSTLNIPATLMGGEGKDTLNGGMGDDDLEGENGKDALAGGGGNDVLSGGRSNDNLAGGEGDDNMSGGKSNDSMDGGLGNDTMDGGMGNDMMLGGGGDDHMEGGLDSDSLDGGDGTDDLFGGDGNDDFAGTDDVTEQKDHTADDDATDDGSGGDDQEVLA